MSFSVRATSRYITMSPRKVRLVLELVRGRPVAEALAVLRYATQAAAQPVSKLIASAAANAQENYGLTVDELFVSEIAANPGPTAKRGRLGGRGRYKPILQRSCHISVALREISPSELPMPAAGRNE
jgi:large subunit ribosomal protein L22